MDGYMKQIITTAIGIVIAIIFISLLLAFPLMLLWNWLMPIIFGLKTITFLQAIGIMFLFNILFKNSSSRSK